MTAKQDAIGPQQELARHKPTDVVIIEVEAIVPVTHAIGCAHGASLQAEIASGQICTSSNPLGMQRLLNAAWWDADAMAITCVPMWLNTWVHVMVYCDRPPNANNSPAAGS
ncbi:hypothetical protein ACFOY2_16930 [Nonomuraea purpurea]|uniref:Uncharacterized protein n=1 Tax=Nonomuraea purpurea TaxID=1849276 RepID=A0ABV8G8C5_9ACTN